MTGKAHIQRYPGTVLGEWQAELRSHQALKFEATRTSPILDLSKTAQTAAERRALMPRLDRPERAQLGSEISRKAGPEGRMDQNGWRGATRPPQGHVHIEPELHMTATAARAALRPEGRLTVHDAHLVYGQLEAERKAITSMLSFEEEIGTQVGRDWTDFSVRLRNMTEKVDGAYQNATSRAQMSEPSLAPANAHNEMRAQMDALRQRITEMKANGGAPAKPASDDPFAMFFTGSLSMDDVAPPPAPGKPKRTPDEMYRDAVRAEEAARAKSWPKVARACRSLIACRPMTPSLSSRRSASISTI